MKDFEPPVSVLVSTSSVQWTISGMSNDMPGTFSNFLIFSLSRLYLFDKAHEMTAKTLVAVIDSACASGTCKLAALLSDVYVCSWYVRLFGHREKR